MSRELTNQKTTTSKERIVDYLGNLARQDGPDHDTVRLATIFDLKNGCDFTREQHEADGRPVAGMSGFRCPIAQYYQHD